MRTLSGKSSARPHSEQAYFPEKRREMIAVGAYYLAERRGFRDGEELGDWLEAEREVEHLLKSERANNPKTSAKSRFQERLEAQLKEWDARLDSCVSRLRGAALEFAGIALGCRIHANAFVMSSTAGRGHSS